MSNLDQALRYAASGWPVVPLHTPTGNADKPCTCNKAGCQSVGKHPRTMHGVADATTDEATIRRWWEQWPKANIGGALGAESGRFAVDVDPRNGGDTAQAALLDQYGDLPTTLTAGTGGDGYHFVFKWPAGYVGKLKGKLGQGIDVKVEGGYIVLAPSLHVSGKPYHWLNEAPSADAPTWLLDKLREPGAGTGASAIAEEIAEGGRLTALLSLAGTMRRKGMAPAEIEAALVAVNENRCKPSLPADEVRQIARSMGKYQPPEDSEPFFWPEAQTENREAKESRTDDQAAFGPGFYSSLAELHAKETIPADDLMIGVRRRQVTIFASVTDVGKTTIMLNHALAAAGGQRWAPLLPEAPGRPLKIVFIDAESTDDELKKDTLTMLRAIGNREIAIENFIPVVDAQIDGEALDLTNKKHFNQLKRFVAYHKPDLLILDTVSALFSLYSENDNAEVIRKIIRPLKELANAGNCAIWASHHIGKSGESDQAEGAYRGRGASAFGANVRGVITLRKEQALGPGYVKLEIAKAKGIKLDPTILKLDFGRRTFEICQAKPEALMPYQTVLGKFNGQPLRTAEIKKLLPFISSSSIDEILRLAIKNGDLTKLKNGVYQKSENPTSQTSQPLIESGKSGKSTQPIEDEELTTSQLEWDENDAWEVENDDFDPTLEALDR